MKKLFLGSAFLFLLFLPISISAAEPDCNNYACGTCTYSIPNHSYEVTYDIQSDGVALQIVDASGKKTDSTSRTVYKFTNELAAENFRNESTNKIQCPSEVYATITGGATGTVVTEYITFTPTRQSSSAYRAVTLKSKTNNDKPVKKEDAPATISCDYKTVTTIGNETVKATIVSDGDMVNVSCTGGYRVLNNTLTGSLFKDSSGKLICPRITMSCGSDRNNKFCSFSPEGNSSRPGGGSSGQETPGAEQLPNYDPNPGGDPEDPSDGFVTHEGCGMLGPELSAWLQWIFNIIKIGGPILAIALGMLDFAKAVFSGEDDSMKKNSKRFFYRLISAALLFLIPFILEIVLDIIGFTSSTCGIQ